MMCFGILVMVCQLQAAPTPPVVCPPVRTWTSGFQKKVAAELRAAPNSALAQVAVQSIGDRDVARACAKAKASK